MKTFEVHYSVVRKESHAPIGMKPSYFINWRRDGSSFEDYIFTEEIKGESLHDVSFLVFSHAERLMRNYNIDLKRIKIETGIDTNEPVLYHEAHVKYQSTKPIEFLPGWNSTNVNGSEWITFRGHDAMLIKKQYENFAGLMGDKVLERDIESVVLDTNLQHEWGNRWGMF